MRPWADLAYVVAVVASVIVFVYFRGRIDGRDECRALDAGQVFREMEGGR